MEAANYFNLSFEGLWQAPAPCLWKADPMDFRVSELWAPSGLAEAKVAVGEHGLLLVRKVGQNTQWVARQLARHAGVRDMDIGFHGLKDRHAVTTQWFSIYAGGRKMPDWNSLAVPGVSILKTGRTVRKLRRGGHQGNRFVVTLREIKGDKQTILSKLEAIRIAGFPNYFGPQRFGIDGNNLRAANDWLTRGIKPRQKSARGIILSAARAYLFNKILEQRVVAGTWSQLIPGDEQVPDDHAAGVQSPSATGPLLGGAEFLSAHAGDVEKAVTEGFAAWLDGLHREGLRTARRPFVAVAENLSATIEGDTICLEFDLLPGSFASVLLAQVFALQSFAGSDP